MRQATLCAHKALASAVGAWDAETAECGHCSAEQATAGDRAVGGPGSQQTG